MSSQPLQSWHNVYSAAHHLPKLTLQGKRDRGWERRGEERRSGERKVEKEVKKRQREIDRARQREAAGVRDYSLRLLMKGKENHETEEKRRV